jgi:Trk K+ transport system NAD-binding subunit
VGEQVRAIDRVAADGVDVVGDVLDQRVLEEAGLGEAQAIVLALETDSATLFATVIVKDVAPEVPVIARVNQSENVERIHRAGADFALSISQVSGQMLARRLLGEEAVAIDPQLTVRRVPTEVLAGRRPAEHGIRERTGCSVVAVERGDRVLVELGGDFRFEPGDAVYVCGDQGRVDRFAEALAG